MPLLLLVSLIWAFSFGLIKGQLGGVDANLVSLIRMSLSLLVFLPWLRWRAIERRLGLQLFFLGMVQYGLMYISYIWSFRYLAAHQVAVFTIFTPLYVTLVHDLFSRRFHVLSLLSALLAIVGTAVVVDGQFARDELRSGFLLVQVSNLCFALGQVWYKRLTDRYRQIRDGDVFALVYAGAVAVTLVAAALTVDTSAIRLGPAQISSLLYLGLIASGLCFFWWNRGARSTGIGSLAVINNLKVPLSVACSLLFFGETGDIPRLLGGGAIILLALFLDQRLQAGRRGR